jgi:hypothetical protein
MWQRRLSGTISSCQQSTRRQETVMHGDLVIHFAKAQQAEIARAVSEQQQRQRLMPSTGGRLGGLRRGRRGRRLRPALPGGGMLPSWRHGSPARGS